jgi:hypothetical protein
MLAFPILFPALLQSPEIVRIAIRKVYEEIEGKLK